LWTDWSVEVRVFSGALAKAPLSGVFYVLMPSHGDPVYQPTTLNLKAHVRTQPVGVRPLIELERAIIDSRSSIARNLARVLLPGQEPRARPL
jgi:hypothetical protein